MMMREVEEEVNQQTIEEGIDPPRVQLLFKPSNEIDFNRFNVPSCNEVCVVFTLNTDQSFPENELIMRQRDKEIMLLKILTNVWNHSLSHYSTLKVLADFTLM